MGKEMNSFMLRKGIPPVHVNIELVSDIEKYLVQRTHELFAHDDGHSQECLIEIKDSAGVQSLDSIEKFWGQNFSDSTSEISVQVGSRTKDFKKKFICNINLKRDLISPSMWIDFNGDRPKELTIGVSQQLMEIFERHANGNKWLHPRFEVIVLLAFVSICSTAYSGIMPIVSGKYTKWTATAWVLGLAIYLFLFPARALSPYISFESKKALKLKRISRFFYGGLASFLVFGCLATFFESVVKKFILTLF